MAYRVHELAKLAGISPRTLRYYDTIGLLRPGRIEENGYRLYGPAEVDLLQHIRFYRMLGLPLEQIKQLVSAPGFDSEAALISHKAALLQKRAQLDRLIDSVDAALSAWKGDTSMQDEEKFEAFKQAKLAKNEETYGKEVRENYGEEAVRQSNEKFASLTQQQMGEAEKLSQEIDQALLAALSTGDPAGPEAQRACNLHHQWLLYFWPAYSKQAHLGLGEMYVSDPRFTAYYDRIAPGCAVFLRDALRHYCTE